MLSVFEHQTIHVGREITQAQFDALVRLNDRSEERLFEVGHRRVTFRQFVGYLQVGALGLEVLPKADQATAVGDAHAWHSFLLEMLRVATGLRLHAAAAAPQTTARASLLDVLALELAEEVSALARMGLAKGYRSHEANEATFRGKLLVSEHVRANHARADRAYCRFTVFDAETMLNRILVTALDALNDVALSPGVREAVNRARAALPPLAVLSQLHGVFDRVKLGRSTARYASALLLARLVIEQRMPQLRSGPTAVFSLMFDMNVLWERYVVALFRRAARGTTVRVDAQATSPFWSARGAGARTIRPDIIVQDKARTEEPLMIADTKWKKLDPGGPRDADLRQMFVYGELLGCGRTVLIYPASAAGGRRIEGRFEGGRRCDTVEVTIAGGRGTRRVMEQVEGEIAAALQDR